MVYNVYLKVYKQFNMLPDNNNFKIGFFLQKKKYYNKGIAVIFCIIMRCNFYFNSKRKEDSFHRVPVRISVLFMVAL